MEMKRVLVPGGSGIYVTDHRDYYEAAAPVIESIFRSRTPHPDSRRSAANELRGEVSGGGEGDFRGSVLEVSRLSRGDADQASAISFLRRSRSFLSSWSGRA